MVVNVLCAAGFLALGIAIGVLMLLPKVQKLKRDLRWIQSIPVPVQTVERNVECIRVRVSTPLGEYFQDSKQAGERARQKVLEKLAKEAMRFSEVELRVDEFADVHITEAKVYFANKNTERRYL